MRVAVHQIESDFALSDHIFALPDWSAEDINQASRVLDGLICAGRDTERASYFKAQIRELAGDFASAASWLDRLRTKGPGETVETYDFDRHLGFTERFAGRAALLSGLGSTRPVYMTCMPESGATYLTSCLAHLLGAFRVRTARGMWNRGTLVPTWVDTAMHACSVMHDTFPASEANLAVLGPRSDLRLLAHVRHPADSLAALYRTLEAAGEEGRWHYALARDLGVPYFHYQSESAENRLTWLVRTVYPVMIDWMEGWLAALQRLGSRMIFCRYEDLLAHEVGLIAGILDHSGYDPDGLPALDGGAPMTLEDMIDAFKTRCDRSGITVPSQTGGDHPVPGEYAAVFSREHCEILARHNGSSVFEALDYDLVDPGLAKG